MQEVQDGGQRSASCGEIGGAALDLIDVVASNNDGAPQSMLTQLKDLNTTVRDGMWGHNVQRDPCPLDALIPPNCAHLGLVNEQCLLIGGWNPIQGSQTKFFMMDGHMTHTNFFGPPLLLL